MVAERIIAWVKEQGRGNTLPANIVYYRDGVGDSQYKDIKDTELLQIQLAFDSVVAMLKNTKKLPAHDNPKVNITAVVCAKRYHTRFYPDAGDEDSKQNCRAGTFVDDVVCSPYYQDFYLQSHCALQGTAGQHTTSSSVTI
jgi:eukaryotic translation initiation factor 2C